MENVTKTENLKLLNYRNVRPTKTEIVKFLKYGNVTKMEILKLLKYGKYYKDGKSPKYGKWNQAKVLFPTAQQVNFPACSHYCPFNAERQAGKL